MEVDGYEIDLMDYIEELLHGDDAVPSHVETGPEGAYGHLAPTEPWPL